MSSYREITHPALVTLDSFMRRHSAHYQRMAAKCEPPSLADYWMMGLSVFMLFVTMGMFIEERMDRILLGAIAVFNVIGAALMGNVIYTTRRMHIGFKQASEWAKRTEKGFREESRTVSEDDTEAAIELERRLWEAVGGMDRLASWAMGQRGANRATLYKNQAPDNIKSTAQGSE